MKELLAQVEKEIQKRKIPEEGVNQES